MIKKLLKPINFTQEGLDKIRKEYETLQKSRPQAVANLKQAREMGDLSENGFYKAARARLSSLDNQLFRLEMMIKLARVKEKSQGVIDIGNKITISDGENERTLTLVGNYEADPSNNMVSLKSPFGKALVGKKESDVILVETPKGKKKFSILKVN